MPDKPTFINAYGEIVSKESLIEEIQALLNRLGEKNTGQATILNVEMMRALDIASLNSIRDSLLQKCGNEVQANLEWLHSLKDGK
ncbi:hypothetical protein [Helicobacter sp. 11S02596-1]|uniref:hypothetical protein n=1 Tax=Helicobacter sp. 11S02596-1 TaxID=1476194 RepID=UPI000BA6EFF1|nr:hypothetical protein [Helicobacter sp. 11S02596-1]PAF41920.1 hypothetical protein BJI48_07635 [Helicobacter sp. 11S02596-1]